MTTRSKRGRSRSSRGARSPLFWDQSSGNLAHAAAASTTFVDLTPYLITDEKNTAQALRLIGQVGMGKTDPEGNGQYVFGFGIGVTTAEALRAGAVTEPLTEEKGWYYWNVVDRFFNDQNPYENVKFDIRTKRNLRSGFRLVAVFETLLNPGATILDFAIRTLFRKN